MEAFRDHDTALGLEAVLPVQFHAVFSESSARTGEMGIIIGILADVVADLRKYRFAKKRSRQKLYCEAYQFIVSTDRVWPFSFENICELLKLNVQCTRAALLDITRS